MNEQWTTVINDDSKKKIELHELSEYRYMIYMLFKRNYKLIYQQTILGPLWLILGPIFSSGIFSLIFGYIGGFQSDGIPYFIFCMSANTLWNAFNACVFKNINVFQDNVYLYGKVYFPRLVVPISNMCYELITFSIQFFVCILVWCFYFINGDVRITGIYLIFVILCPILMIIFGTSIGILVSSLSVKFRDLSKGIHILMQLFMYASPIIYSTAQVPDLIRPFFYINPITGYVECFRYAFTGAGNMKIGSFLYSFAVTAIMAVIAVVVYERVSKDFIDVV